MATRILAGPRVVDVITGHSTPLSEAAGVLSLWGSSTDLSTLFCGCMQGIGPPPGGGVNLNCVRHAYETYDNAVKTAMEVMEACTISAVAAFALCMAGCAAGAILGGGLGVVIAVISCLAALVLATAGCEAAYLTLNSANRQLAIDLRACGLNMVKQ
ncbi:MAG: hypothetical protein IT437_12730 [Phycisphaerales bacterium]|nr:hypothetical protein [Phycisphaerales bacterium]